MRTVLSIVIPALSEAEHIVDTLQTLQASRKRGVELIVVDGGSKDGTLCLATPLADKVLKSPCGRALQMNAGAHRAGGEVLLFLHADTVLPDGAVDGVLDGLRKSSRVWGRFDVRINGASPMFRVIALMMNLRSRWSGIATGDQAMFVKREDFFAIGGFPDQPLMEDIALSARLKARSAPLCLRQRVTTSGRRWEQAGIWRTVLLMWRLRLLYWLGTPPDRLAKGYR